MTSAVLLLVLVGAAGDKPVKVTVGSKAYTESVVLGEMAVLLAENTGARVEHKDNLGGTRILWSALLDGAIDLYPEYTGTLREELFRGEDLPDLAAIRARLAKENVLMSEPLGFNNSYAIGVKESVTEQLNLRTISDLKQHPELRCGFSSEFMKRGEGWPSLKDRYGLSFKKVRGLEHALAYRAVDAGEIDLTDIYTTDPNIKKYSLRTLVDDLGHFPQYEAVFVYRTDLPERAPLALAALKKLEGRISNETMLALNERVEMEKQSKKRVAADFLNEQLSLSISPRESGLWERLLKTTLEHLLLVGVSLVAAILVSIPLGVAAAKNKLAGQFIIGTTEIIQTIPGLALLVLLTTAFDPLGLPIIGPVPAITALFLYSLLPIVRNTMTGLTDVPNSLKESALALGLSPFARLRLIELPLASRLILAGIKTTAVINVGYAALGGLIGAGGYGQTIKTGLDLNSPALMMEGAIPAALLALSVKGIFELAERFVVPKGLRIAAAR
jgi:osmoprotectant transport system permease protein